MLLVVTPCRNEAEFAVATLESVIRQTLKPDLWIIVDDGSTDATPEILAEYARKVPWIKVLSKEDRGHRAVGPGVVNAFYRGLCETDLADYEFLCKLDLDLELPNRYFETLIGRMRANPRIGTCSGKAYFKDEAGTLISEKIGDEMSVGATKLYRVTCFNEIGGFVREVMWDGIDCHACRRLGWIACSWDEPELRFIHFRPMGSSQKGILTGRMRHGFGQYFMGSSPLYFCATTLYRMCRPPYIIGGLAMLYGYLRSFLQGSGRYEDPDFRRFLRRYQHRVLMVGKKRAIAEIDACGADVWAKRRGVSEPVSG